MAYGDENLQVSIVADNQTGPGLAAARASVQDFSASTAQGLGAATAAANQFTQGIGDLAKRMAEVALAAVGLSASMQTLRSAFNFADQIRDVEMSMRLLSSSVQAGEAIFQKFRASADQTRSTTLELATAWREALPAAMRRGISDETLGQITIQLAKVAPLIGQGLDQTIQQFEQIMAGRVRKTSVLANLLLGGTGYTIEDLIKGGKADEIFGAMFGNLEKLAAKGAEFGQTFESAGKKIKDSFFEAFSKGFLATGEGWDRIYKQLTGRELLEGIENIGKAFRNMLPAVVEVMTAVGRLVGWIAQYGTILGTGISAFMGNERDDSASNLTWAGKKGATFAGGVPFNVNSVAGGAPAGARTQGPLNNFGAPDTSLFDYLNAVDALQTKLSEGKSPIPLVNELTRSFIDQGKEIDKLTADYSKILEAERALILPLSTVIELTNQQYDKDRAALEDNAAATIIEHNEKALRSYSEQLDQFRAREAFNLGNLPPQFGGPALAKLDAGIAATRADMAMQIYEVHGAEAMKKYMDQFKEGGTELVKSADKAGQMFAAHVRASVTDLTRDIQTLFSAITGGGTLGSGLESIGKNFIQQGGKLLVDLIGSLFAKVGGDPNLVFNPQTGGYSITRDGVTKSYTSLKDAQAGGENIGGANWGAAVLGGAGAIYGGATARQSDTSAALGGIAAGYSVALALASTGYGAIVGVIVALGTYIGHLLQPPAGKDYSYASFGVYGGEAKFGGNNMQNITAAQQASELAKIQTSFDTFYDGYMKILMKFPLEILPSLLRMLPTMRDYSPIIGLPGGGIGHAASQSFFANFDAWVNGTLPKEIAKTFFEPLSKALLDIGLSADAFKGIWDKLQLLDPKMALQAIGTLAAGIGEISKAIEYLNRPFSTAANPRAGLSMLNFADSQANQSFSSSIADGAKQILLLQESISHLSTAEQINTLKQIGDLMTQRASDVKKFIQSIYDAMNQFAQSTQDRIDQYKLALMVGPDGKPDIAAQIAFLKGQADRYLALANASNDPATVMRYGNLAQDAIAKIVSLGGSTTEFLNWALKNTTTVGDAIAAHLLKIGADFDRANKVFMDKFTAANTAWMKGLAASADGMAAVASSADHASAALDRFTARLDRSGGGGGGDGGNTGSFVGSTAYRRVVSRAA